MCVFCDIIEGKIPSSKIYEDDTVVAFLDLSQVTKGHALVVPKAHYDHFLSCDSDTLAHLMQVAQKLANHIMQVTNAAGMNILSNVNEAAGQSVMHFHVHLIPRYDERTPSLWNSTNRRSRTSMPWPPSCVTASNFDRSGNSNLPWPVEGCFFCVSASRRSVPKKRNTAPIGIPLQDHSVSYAGSSVVGSCVVSLTCST
ncbi:MAG: HIT family protein, partial [Merdibacter sp.]